MPTLPRVWATGVTDVACLQGSGAHHLSTGLNIGKKSGSSPGQKRAGTGSHDEHKRWLIAFVEYCLAVPANRWGSEVYTTAQLKTIQEVITLVVFAAFSVLYLKEPMTWNYAIGFVLVASGAFFIFRGPL